MDARAYNKRKLKLFWASFLVMLGVLAFYLIWGFVKVFRTQNEGLAKDLVSLLLPYGITAIALLSCVVLISNKFRTTAWMINAMLGTIIFNRIGLIVTFAIWIVDEYVLFRLYQKNKRQQEIMETVNGKN